MLMMLEKPRRTAGEQMLAALLNGIYRTARAIDAALTWPFHCAENRRTLAALAAMDDHVLRDIGLTRHDLRAALSLPARDSTDLLAARRDERRHPR